MTLLRRILHRLLPRRRPPKEARILTRWTS